MYWPAQTTVMGACLRSKTPLLLTLRAELPFGLMFQSQIALRKKFPLAKHKMRGQPHSVRSTLMVQQGFQGAPKTNLY